MKSFNGILTLALAFLFACGGSGNDRQPQQAESASSTQQAEITDEVRTVELIGIDQMKFVVSESQEGVFTGDTIASGGNTYFVVDSIAATPGEELQVKLENISSLPPSAMSHNFALLELGTDAQAFSNASSKAKDNEYIAPDMEDKVIVTTEMLGGDETDTISFTVPEQEGRYDYVCSFPGHFSAGMKGKLIVE